MIQKSTLLTKKEVEVINKRLKHKKLTQQDSNYLSRYVRPKLRAISQLDSKLLLQKIEYNQKIPKIEKYIKKLVLKNIKNVSSITIYGSAIYNNYHDCNDIDVLVTVKKKTWKRLAEKYDKIHNIVNKAKPTLSLDMQVYLEKEVYGSYPSSPSLIYQLKDKKTIYGKLKLPKKIAIPKLYLRMKLDYSDIYDEDSKSEEILKAIRNTWLVKLIMDKIINNNQLNKIIEDELGKNSIKRLKYNKASKAEKKRALIYSNEILNNTLKTLKNSRWERIVL